MSQPPGVYFDFVERPAPNSRRRSDIAGFAGFIPATTSDKPFVCNGYEDFLAQAKCRTRKGYSEVSEGSLDASEGYLAAAVQGFFSNGGRTCWIAPVCQRDLLQSGKVEHAIEQLGNIDQVSMLAVPDAGRCGHTEEDKESRRKQIQQAMIAQAEQLRDRIVLLDPPADWMPQEYWEGQFPTSESAFAALYWPWLKIRREVWDRDGGGWTRAVPPCGHIAGTIARRDLERGVFAPPANMVIEGVVGVAGELTDEDRAAKNDVGMNVIVALPGRGVRAMGARTLRNLGPSEPQDSTLSRRGSSKPGDSDSFKWLNVRRLVTHLCEWIAEDTQWTVFEPRDEALWRATERLVRTILFDLWRRGGLVGATDDEAYFVRCDKTTNSAEAAEEGRVVCLVGLRPPPPAEMITVRVGLAEGRVELLDHEITNG